VNERVLLRLLNAGLKSVVPALDGGAYLSLVAEDGQPYPYAKQQYSTLLAAGKSIDAVLTPTRRGASPSSIARCAPPTG